MLFNIKCENEPGVIAANVKEFTALEMFGLKKLYRFIDTPCFAALQAHLTCDLDL